MSATIIPFPRRHRDELARMEAEIRARSEAALAADPVRRAMLAKAREAIAKLPLHPTTPLQ